MTWVKRGILRILLGVFLIFAMLTSFGDYLDTTLTLHMIVQHLFFVAGGFLLTSGADMLVLAASAVSGLVSRVYAGLLRINAAYNKKGLVAFLAAGILVAYWHLPANFDAAVLNEGVHIQMHMTFLLVGSLIFVGSKLLTWRVRTFLLLIPSKAMGVFGAYLMFTTGYVYPVYPEWQQAECGLAMVVMMLGMDLTLVPYWLYKYFKTAPTPVLHVSSRQSEKT
jgi:cytochrome c oxidase assembly factor CtaG